MTAGRFSATPIVSYLRTAVDAALWIVYPSRCCLCGEQASHSLCAECADGLVQPLQEPVCPTCGHTRPQLPCSHCAVSPPKFVAARAAGPFGGDLQHVIHLMKYRDKPQLAIPLGKRLARYAQDISHSLGDLEFDCVSGIPMRGVRQRRRGYNQSERLARVVADELRLPCSNRLLARQRSVKPQMQLTRQRRLTNLVGVFAVRDDVRGKRILLVDDVSTTGATFRECAAVLREAGAKTVYCVALAAG